MAFARHHDDQEPPRKRAKLDKTPKHVHKFQTGAEIHKSLRNSNRDSLTETLTTLRNQLTVKHNEPSVSPQDERLLLVTEWFDISPGAQDLLEVWENTNQREMSLLASILSVFSCTLTLVSSHYIYQSLGHPIVKSLLSNPYIHRLNSYLGGSHAELTLVSLKLFNALSAFAGGKERKTVLDSFAWDNKSLPKLYNMRRKGKGGADQNILHRPDIRTLYILFVLSFVDSTTGSFIKFSFLEQQRNVFTSVFKGFAQDPYPVVRHVLEVCWNGILSDPKLKRTLKVSVFNEATISHIIKLYERNVSELAESDEPEQVPADLAHHFLLALCTRPGVGVCFKDRGWYPRESDDDEARLATEESNEKVSHRGGKIYNKILANVLKILKVNDDQRQQELAIKILTACPELVGIYWPLAALTLEPRLSSRWIANISFFGSVISLPVPTSCFILDDDHGSSLYSPSPPSLSTILENVLPSVVNWKSHMTKGLQSPSPLVQHCTALALAKCLIKYAAILKVFTDVETALEEKEEDGQWYKRRKDLEKEVRRRVPEFQVIVAFSQQHKASSDTESSSSTSNPIRTALLAESAQRLLWLYHRCVPALIAEARFDVGKLLHALSVQGEEPEGSSGLQILRCLHALRLLKESDQFIWHAKTGSSHSNVYILLRMFATTRVQVICAAVGSLLRHAVLDSVIFQEGPEEIELWLASLPTSARARGAECPDDAPLTDERDSVVTFLDDCFQRCLKTPYRYLEEMERFVADSDAGAGATSPCSALIMTVMEQLDAKTDGGLLSPSDTLAIASFIRKLVLRLSAKQHDLLSVIALATRLDTVLAEERLYFEHPIMSRAIRREVSILTTCLQRLGGSDADDDAEEIELDARELVQEFLDQVEEMPTPLAPQMRELTASELIDWVRLLEQPLHPDEALRCISCIQRIHEPALKDLFEYLHPTWVPLWSCIHDIGLSCDTEIKISFEWLFVHCRTADLGNSDCQAQLVFSSRTTSFERALCLVCHRIAGTPFDDMSMSFLLSIFLAIVKEALSKLTPEDCSKLKRYIFLELPVVRDLCRSSSLLASGEIQLNGIVNTVLDPVQEEDRSLASDISGHWLEVLKDSIAGIDTITLSPAKFWIAYFPLGAILDLFDSLTGRVQQQPCPSVSTLLEAVFEELSRHLQSSSVYEALRSRLRALVTMQCVFPGSVIVRRTVARVLERTLPFVGGSNWFFSNTSNEKLRAVCGDSEERWSHRMDQLPPELMAIVLSGSSSPTSFDSVISSSALYRSLPARQRLWKILAPLDLDQEASLDIDRSVQCSFDVASALNEPLSGVKEEFQVSLIKRWLQRLLDVQTAAQERVAVCASICSLFGLSSNRSRLASVLYEDLRSSSAKSVSAELLSLGRRLLSVPDANPSDAVQCLVDRGLQWAVRQLSVHEEGTDSFHKTTRELRLLSEKCGGTKAHLVEPVVTAAIQNKFALPAAIELVTTLIQTAHFKPVVVNRYLQSVVQHPLFFKVAYPESLSRDAVVAFLHALFHLHPSNTCQPSHIEPLIHIYRATLSVSDCRLLSIFRLFEAQRKTSVSSILSCWSASPDLASTTTIEAIGSLDSNRVFRTCLLSPSWRTLEDSVERNGNRDAQLYDPIFLTLLFARMLSEAPPTSALQWVELFRTNILCLLLRALSSPCGRLRETALCQLAATYKTLQAADVQEKPYVLYVLDILKDSFSVASEGPPARLPSYSTLVLAHAMRGIFYPSNFIYPHTARFLLQRPELDLSDVPMLYGILYSSSDEWKKERGWIIRFLADGMRSSHDWKVLKRRHTWDLLASLFQSSENDRLVRNGIMEVLANITGVRQAVTALVLKSALLSWIEMQLTHVREGESVAWIKILENILAITDAEKLETLTKGAWRAALCRCLHQLLRGPSGLSSSVLAFATPVILRLCLLPGERIPQLSCLVEQSLVHVQRIEDTITRPEINPDRLYATLDLPTAPHQAQNLHEVPEFDPFVVWGKSVEALWRATMTFDERTNLWDKLTSRLLVWRAIVGEEGSEVGEWVRREVIRNMQVE